MHNYIHAFTNSIVSAHGRGSNAFIIVWKVVLAILGKHWRKNLTEVINYTEFYTASDAELIVPTTLYNHRIMIYTCEKT